MTFRAHPILGAVLVIVAGLIASWWRYIADGLQRFDASRFNE